MNLALVLGSSSENVKPKLTTVKDNLNIECFVDIKRFINDAIRRDLIIDRLLLLSNLITDESLINDLYNYWNEHDRSSEIILLCKSGKDEDLARKFLSRFCSTIVATMLVDSTTLRVLTSAVVLPVSEISEKYGIPDYLNVEVETDSFEVQKQVVEESVNNNVSSSNNKKEKKTLFSALFGKKNKNKLKNNNENLSNTSNSSSSNIIAEDNQDNIECDNYSYSDDSTDEYDQNSYDTDEYNEEDNSYDTQDQYDDYEDGNEFYEDNEDSSSYTNNDEYSDDFDYDDSEYNNEEDYYDDNNLDSQEYYDDNFSSDDEDYHDNSSSDENYYDDNFSIDSEDYHNNISSDEDYYDNSSSNEDYYDNSSSDEDYYGNSSNSKDDEDNYYVDDLSSESSGSSISQNELNEQVDEDFGDLSYVHDFSSREKSKKDIKRSKSRLKVEEVEDLSDNLSLARDEEEYRRKTEKPKVIQQTVVKEVVKSVGRGSVIDNIYKGLLHKLIVVTGDRRTGVTTLSWSLAMFFAKKVPVLYFDCDTDRHGLMNYIDYLSFKNYDESHMKGVKLCRNSKAFSSCVCRWDTNIDLLTTDFGVNVTEDELILTQGIVAENLNKYGIVIVDCPVSRLHCIQDLILTGNSILCMEDSPRGMMNMLISMDESPLPLRYKRSIVNKGTLVRMFANSNKDYKKIIKYINQIVSLEDCNYLGMTTLTYNGKLSNEFLSEILEG